MSLAHVVVFYLITGYNIEGTNFCSEQLLKLIIINYDMYELIYNKYILYNGLSNYIRNEVIKFYIKFIIYHEKWTL
jgi:hypothetical protein